MEIYSWLVCGLLHARTLSAFFWRSALQLTISSLSLFKARPFCSLFTLLNALTRSKKPLRYDRDTLNGPQKKPFHTSKVPGPQWKKGEKERIFLFCHDLASRLHLSSFTTVPLSDPDCFTTDAVYITDEKRSLSFSFLYLSLFLLNAAVTIAHSLDPRPPRRLREREN